MAHFETDFKVLKDEKGKVNGFSLIAQPHTESEYFCGSFPKALVEGKADIKFEEGKIIFEHPTARYPGNCTHELDKIEGVELQKLLNSDIHLTIEKAGFLTQSKSLKSSIKKRNHEK